MSTLETRGAVPATTHTGVTGTGAGLGHHHDHTLADNRGVGAGTGGYGYDGNTGYGAGPAYGHENRRIANPHPLGALSFGATLFIYSLYSVRARGIHATNAILGQALFVGGLAQLLAGMWAFPRNSTHAATVYTLFGAFWLSLAVNLIPGTGVSSAYETTGELQDALGIYFITWMVASIVLLLGSVRKSAAFVAFFFFLTLFFLLSSVGFFRKSDKFFKAGGGLGIVASLIAIYIGLSKLWESDRSFPRSPLPLMYLGKKDGAAHGGAVGTGRPAKGL